MQSPPRYTPCNGLMYETDFGNYVSYLDWVALKESQISLSNECERLANLHRDMHQLINNCAKNLDITITAPECKPGLALEQFIDGAKKLAKRNNVVPDFRLDLENLINKYSKETYSNTPDFILAKFLCDSLEAWNRSVKHREEWYGRY